MPLEDNVNENYTLNSDGEQLGLWVAGWGSIDSNSKFYKDNMIKQMIYNMVYYNNSWVFSTIESLSIYQSQKVLAKIYQKLS